MRVLIVLRHGDHECNVITPHGAKKLRTLAEQLTRFVQGTAMVVCPDTPRAEESANIMAEWFDPSLRVSVHKALEASSYDRYFRNVDQITAEVARCGEEVDTLIVVSHLPFVAMFPRHFGLDCLGADFPAPAEDDADDEHPMASAVIIDCVAKTCEPIIPSG